MAVSKKRSLDIPLIVVAATNAPSGAAAASKAASHHCGISTNV
jgi:hypothetical protein